MRIHLFIPDFLFLTMLKSGFKHFSTLYKDKSKEKELFNNGLLVIVENQGE